MAGPHYPLEPVRQLRDTRVEEALAELGAAVRAREDAERERGEAEARRVAHRAATERVRAAERLALEQGALRAVDLAQEHAWQGAVDLDDARLAATVRDAAAYEDRCRAAEATAQTALAVRKADAEAVARDRARWDRAMQQRTEARDEEASLEAWRPGR